ncbi:hypothetical protein [Helicobacter cappadocius]|uniref:Uncharacterized protein n=1 Tax=Helicobacter cappadocius TaxID=3063998 RepID=A0AA90TEY1_9HELI|nr:MULTISPECIES: hypothetical protein [unclassified Helicobacter]MDO7252920.1 hypothetical protein [Helicobacter sp. faydin-H75]MDP2539090.1 hypothetical protein [Helicobacter sp. faydin-H76]
MGFQKFDFKTWLFPSVCFGLFCYGMVFIFIYTYSPNEDASLFSNTKNTTNVTDVSKFREEMMKQIKKIN